MLPSGQGLRLWDSTELCGSKKMTGLRAEFLIPDVDAAETVAALAAKRDEPHWNVLIGDVQVSGFDRGALGLQEVVKPPKGLSSWPLWPTRIWEWQALAYNHTQGSYIMAVVTDAANKDLPFDPRDEVDVCRASFEVRPAPEMNGTLVRVSSALNAHLWLPLRWSSAERDALEAYALALTSEAQRLSRLCARGGLLDLDGDILAMLSVPPPGASHVSVARVLQQPDWLSGFRNMDVPSALDTGGLGPGQFQRLAEDIVSLFKLLSKFKSVATVAEIFASRGDANDALALQEQGQTLAALQLLLRAQWWADQCVPPNLDNVDLWTGVTVCVGCFIVALVWVIYTFAVRRGMTNPFFRRNVGTMSASLRDPSADESVEIPERRN